MSRPRIRLLPVLAFALWTPTLHANAPACYTTGGGLCQYIGPVSKAYINDTGLILLYFDVPVDPAAPSSVGITGVSQYEAAAFPVADNADFAKFLYATMLAAQARGATVQVQMRTAASGYLKIDRIWVNE